MLNKAAYTPYDASLGREFSLSPKGDIIGGDISWNFSFHETLDSTNLEGRRQLAEGRTGKQVIVAETQTLGQCRHDRLWESKPGRGMWASFILPVTVPFSVLAQSTLVLAAAVREGVEKATGVALAAKWPNDLLGGGKKCCGMLVESGEILPDAATHHLILGVGVNIGHTEDDFPGYLRETATSLAILSGGGTFSRDAVTASVARSIETWFARWEKEGFSPIRHAWLYGNCTIGNRIILLDGYGYSHATALDLDESGALVALADDGTTLLIDSGEIRFTNAT
jgi:BirA family biotin operon repressor/biotin-[acetyl-CoA-carboxylase] ligase